MLVTGWVSSRIGAKATLVTGLSIIVVFAALAGLSGSIGEIVGFRAGWGLGNALFIATSLAVIVACASGGFAGAIILYETALGVGIALGPLVGGLLGSVSWRAPFFGVAVLMAIALVATLVLLDKTPKPAQKIGLLDPIRALRHRSLATIARDRLRLQLGLLHPARVLAYSMGHLARSASAPCSPRGACWSRSSRCSARPALERRFGTVRVLYFVLGLLALDLLVIAVWQTTPAVVIGAVIVAGAMIGLNNTLVTQAVMSVAPVAAAGRVGVVQLRAVPRRRARPVDRPASSPRRSCRTPRSGWRAVVVAVGILVLSTAHRLLRRAETAEVAEEPAALEPTRRLERPVLVAVDDAPHTGRGRRGRRRGSPASVDAPVLLVHVPEDAVVGDATPVGDDAGVLTGRVAAADRPGLPPRPSRCAPVASHDAVGLALADLARRRDARAVVVGSPHGGPLPRWRARVPTAGCGSTPTAPSS